MIYPPEPSGFVAGNPGGYRIPEETGFYRNLQDWERHHAVQNVRGYGEIPSG